ncbi:MAG: mandelate racemase/muconate lactonizing enzyme family protein [Acidobacteria bacterium]|nr:mandelate racemase/muconate lactonizing enzyme family protein [Acidobacteriota bacterium]
MSDRIQSVEVFPLSIPRDVPYLGALEPGVTVNEKGCFVRPGNRTVYSTSDHSVLVRLTTAGGAFGWGECVSVVAPQVAATIIRELLGPLLVGRDPMDSTAIFEDLYNAMRVRGYFGGFYVDALAALDIAIWDLKGKLTSLPVCKLLGGQRHDRIPAYVSGLPAPTLDQRVEIARLWTSRGFPAVKFAAAVADQGEYREMRRLREALGPDIKILVDLHWRYTAAEAIQIIRRLEEFDLYLAEAPVHAEDIEGQAEVARGIRTPVGLGEELRTAYEFLPRFLKRCMDVIQPEMGRTGITSFAEICQAAKMFHCRVMPHASIGIGIFQAASLHASAALPHLVFHEYQHSIFDRNLRFLEGSMACANGFFTLPEGPGLGVQPNSEVLRFSIPC